MSRDEDQQRTTRLYDKRVIQRHIKKGLTTTKDYEKHLKALPDTADKVAPMDRAEIVDDDDRPENDVT